MLVIGRRDEYEVASVLGQQFVVVQVGFGVGRRLLPSLFEVGSIDITERHTLRSEFLETATYPAATNAAADDSVSDAFIGASDRCRDK